MFDKFAGVEQSVLGGVAHMLSFTGSDTMSAGYYAQVSHLIVIVILKIETPTSAGLCNHQIG